MRNDLDHLRSISDAERRFDDERLHRSGAARHSDRLYVEKDETIGEELVESNLARDLRLSGRTETTDFSRSHRFVSALLHRLGLRAFSRL